MIFRLKTNRKGKYLEFDFSKFGNDFSFRKTFDKMAFLAFCLAMIEIGSDFWSSYNFISGNYYVKTVENIMDEAVTSFQCRKIQTTYTYNYETNSNGTMHTFRCFEKDPIWGAVTFAIIPFGSLWFCVMLKPKIVGFENCIWKLIQNFVFLLFFPFIFVFVKFVTIFSGEEDKWKSASMAMTQIEGVYEGQCNHSFGSGSYSDRKQIFTVDFMWLIYFVHMTLDCFGMIKFKAQLLENFSIDFFAIFEGFLKPNRARIGKQT